MRTSVRTSIAVLFGAVFAFISVAAIESLGHQIYPVPTDIDWSDAEQVQSHIQGLPVGAIFFVIGAWIGKIAE